MATTIERRTDALPRLVDWFDDLFPWLERTRGTDLIRVEETMDDGTLVIRAEMPGIDPEKDVDITVADGRLTITAERRQETTETDDGRTRTEFRYGTFMRTLTVPRESTVEDITAGYKDGILTITIPMPEPKAPEATKVTVTRH